jgi:hypothetical protein
MVTFVSLHRGPDIPSARPVAVSVDPELVACVAALMLDEREPDPPGDAALDALVSGRQHALRLIAGEGH